MSYYDNPIDEETLPAEIRGYDWHHVFECVGSAEGNSYNTPSVSVCQGSSAKPDEFNRSDVKQVIAVADGEHDGPDWIGVFLLKDGRFAFVRAGCDYTGWDCQSGGAGWVSHSLENLVKFGLGVDEYERLKPGLGGIEK